ncbi:MAG: outer membrane beta-barrel protein [Caulobacteraceae bacterium]
MLAAAPVLAQPVTNPNASTSLQQEQQQVQAAGQGMFTRDRNVSVSQRPHPGYDPNPVQLGGFTALPKLDAGVEFNDNIYAVNTGKKSDTIWTVNPEVDIQSNWSRNALQAFVRSATREYSKYSSETTTDYQVGAAGRLDAGEAKLSAGGDTGEMTEPRTSPSTTSGNTHPVRYQQTDGFFSAVQELNRVRLTGRIDIANLDYTNGVDPAGHSVLEDDRDRTDYVYSGKAEYAISPDTAVYLNAAYNDHQYRLTPPTVALNKSSHGETVSGGANFDLTNTIRGDIQVGWMQQQFAANVLRTYSGFSALASVEWFPTQLTTVTLTGSRQVQDSATATSAIYIASGVGGQIDHELLRNLILTGRVGYEDDAYQGVSRDDKSTNAYVGARYLVNRLVGVTLGYTYANNSSSGSAKGPAYTVNRIMASLNLRF